MNALIMHYRYGPHRKCYQNFSQNLSVCQPIGLCVPRMARVPGVAYACSTVQYVKVHGLLPLLFVMEIVLHSSSHSLQSLL